MPPEDVNAAEESAAAPNSEATMLSSERRDVAVGRGRAEDGPWLGLALSGGGIRSATFCLGALQALAKSDLLKHFDYLSSVSGGGYTASALQWKLHDSETADTGSNFPYGTAETSSLADENENLKYLRWHASYLAPGGGISIWSGIGVLLRTVLISLFVWLPVATAVMVTLHVITGAYAFVTAYNAMGEITVPKLESMVFTVPWLTKPMSDFAGVFLAAMALLLAIAIAGTLVLVVISILIPPETTDNRADRLWRAWQCALIGIIGITASIGTRWWYLSRYNPGSYDPVTAAVIITASGFGVFAFCAIVVGILQAFSRLEFGVNYWARRRYELGATWWFPLLIGLAVLASLPFVYDLVAGFLKSYPTWGKAVLGLFTVASGFLSGLYGHFVQAQRLAPNYAARWAASVAAGAFLYLMALLAYACGRFLIDAEDHISLLDLQYAREYFVALLVFSTAFGLWSNLNYLGLHRFYRDRLMEAFLPSDEQRAAEAPNYSDADRVALSSIWPPKVARPYPLINTNVIMINDKEQTLALRGGASFLLSPLFVGSSPTGWLPTIEHDKKHGPMTLASAMAASGAAANANAAYIGSGITRDRFVSIVMMLLNFRLGLWIGAPTKKSGTPNYFSPALRFGVLRAGYRRDSDYLELTDGGHFDNLGAYELIRRRCDLIVALDSEEDPTTAMSALASICQRAREDFNVEIRIVNEADTVVPTGDLGYPSGAKIAKQCFFAAAIEYPDRPEIKEKAKTGTFVYLKSGMIKELTFSAKGYKAKFPEFPNQSTMDQFFDPAQFEAYRELGYASAKAFIKTFDLESVSTPAGLFGELSSFLAQGRIQNSARFHKVG